MVKLTARTPDMQAQSCAFFVFMAYRTRTLLRSFSMDPATLQKLDRKARAAFVSYLRGSDFQGFIMRFLPKPAWWNLLGWYQLQKAHLPFKEINLELAAQGNLVLGLVLMWNRALTGQPGKVAPALVLGTYDFSPRGLEELLQVAWHINDCRSHEDAQVRQQAEGIFEDEDFHFYRRRALPPLLGVPSHYVLFDSLVSGDLMLPFTMDGEWMELPFTLLFANLEGEVLASAVAPRTVALPVIKAMIAGGPPGGMLSRFELATG